MSDHNKTYSSARLAAAALADLEQCLRAAAQFARIEGTRRHDLRLTAAGCLLDERLQALHQDAACPTPEHA